MLHTACPIFNMDTNIHNSLLTLTNELTSGNSHHGANTDHHSTETQSRQMNYRWAAIKQQHICNRAKIKYRFPEAVRTSVRRCKRHKTKGK